MGPILERSIHLCDHHRAAQTLPTRDDGGDGDLLFLMVQRKDTMGFVDFVRGTYTDANKDALLRTYLGEMTCHERLKLLTVPFDDIWSDMWKNHDSKCYQLDHVPARHKMSQLDLPALLDEVPCRWTEQEYGFPKGRKDMNETDKECAMREFCEETGYTPDQIRFLDLPPFEERFTGTNGEPYRHVYYVAEIPQENGAPILGDSLQQTGEVGNIAWFTFQQCIDTIRSYDRAKKDVLRRVFTAVQVFF